MSLISKIRQQLIIWLVGDWQVMINAHISNGTIMYDLDKYGLYVNTTVINADVGYKGE